MNYLDYYDLESYLFNTVRPRFDEQRRLSAFDFFCIIIWKANRAKTTYATKLLEHKQGYKSLEDAVSALTTGLASQPTDKDRLRHLREWHFNLPMATAVLTVLYPDDFTVYDTRVCAQLSEHLPQLPEFDSIANTANFEKMWTGYCDFRKAVRRSSAPAGLSLRDKDRYLWGKSFHDELTADVADNFGRLRGTK